MGRRPYDLPSLSALTAFEAAARHVSFKRAAAELNVTPAAVSHQIKALEAELDRVLFQRNPRGVELTEAGAVLLVALQRGFEQMSDGIAQIRLQPDAEAVSIQVTTAMSSLWLTPRLSQFWKVHGNIPVSQNVTDTPGTSVRTDLSIVYGDVGDEAADQRLLFKDRISAMASPAFAATADIRGLDDLARLPLIHLSAANRSWTGWNGWAGALGYDGRLGGGLQVNNYFTALQAACDGMGVVLVWERLTRGMIESGKLVRVLPDVVEAPLGYRIVARRGAPARALRLRDWLVASAG
ncbi:LysR substrate-binding domain-containing protein [Thalassococcus sp. BH17M4-6]|uniref:LysR substrate-binding domain-containing protein n=1 Tax=Thalassococcus sp. BH17M4-6 TaxID=3413148 RepID=UPI003BEC0EB8